MEERQELPPDAPEADVAEQKRDWDDKEPDKEAHSVPPDAPEADYLDQIRDAGLDDEEQSRD